MIGQIRFVPSLGTLGDRSSVVFQLGEIQILCVHPVVIFYSLMPLFPVWQRVEASPPESSGLSSWSF